jgi:hypothetical protein
MICLIFYGFTVNPSIILSAHWILASMSLSVRGLPCGKEPVLGKQNTGLAEPYIARQE